MTPDQFFAKFALLSETPNAIQKMRELILDLAVSGRLMTCPRNSTTVNADFSLSKLKDISVKITDGTHKTPHYVESGVPFVSVKDFSGGKLDLSDTRFITKDEHTLLFRRCDPRRGDILLGRIGTLGKAVVVDVDIEFSLFVSAALIRPRLDVLDSDFLRFALNSPFVTDQFNHIKVGGATHTNKLNLGDLGGIQIPLPPLAEQKRIVAKVDELMALCDQLESQQKQRETKKATLVQAALTRFTDAPTPANLSVLFHPSYAINTDEIRSAVLALAVQGQLVRQLEIDGNADVYFQRPTSLLLSVLPDLPAQWTWARVDETGRVDLGRQRAPQHHLGPNMRPYLRVQNVYEARIDISDVKSMNFTPSEFETFALQWGDILLNEGQSHKLVGRPAIYRGEVPGACFQNTLVRYRGHEFIFPEYALVVFRAYMRNGRFQKISKQTTNIAHLSAGRFASLEFPVPPLAEQKRIVAKVEELMALVDKLEAQLAASRDAGAKLIEAVVAAIAAAA